MKNLIPFLGLLTVGLSIAVADEAASAAKVASVKDYLVSKLAGVKTQSDDLVKNAKAYEALAQAQSGSIAIAYEIDPKGVDELIVRMKENYKAIDSFGYETVEGIVAGVPAMAHYDITLDAGVPASEGPDDVAEVVLTLSDGSKIDRQGALFTYLLEPALWGGNPQWCVKAGDKLLPRPEVLLAVAEEIQRQITSLEKDAQAWKASVTDCFGAMIVMTPTLSDYFEDWKESRFSEEKSGRFQAVSRISDMRGIMGSCAVMFAAVSPDVSSQDPALAKSIRLGFTEIFAFLDALESKEEAGSIQAAEIDELAAQAKEKTDKLVPQIEQAAAVAGVQVSG